MAGNPKKIVVIDDERHIQLTLSAVLERQGYEVKVAGTAAAGRKSIAASDPDLVLLDLGLPDEEGLEVLRGIKRNRPKLPVIVLTAHDSLANAIESIKQGAFHFFSKPYVPEELLSLCARAIEQNVLETETAELRVRADQLEKRLAQAERQLAPVSRSRAMQEILDLVDRVAPSEANVLITGESGVGKEILANEIHRLSARSTGPLVKLNCAAFPPNMIESELFGYVKGAFTGAVQDFSGLIAEAHSGSLFLDEISEMPIELQTRFLRVLQEREFRRLGSTKNVKANFRLIAATNRRPDVALREGKLREDLYFRLNTFQLEIPPLRDRREDVRQLAETFIIRFAQQRGSSPPVLARETLRALVEYPWPGNVRELQNAMEHAVVLCDSGRIEMAHLPRELRHPTPLPSLSPTPQSLLERERAALAEALARSGGNKRRAAELLGLYRATFYAKLKRHGLHPKATPPPAASQVRRSKS